MTTPPSSPGGARKGRAPSSADRATPAATRKRAASAANPRTPPSAAAEQVPGTEQLPVVAAQPGHVTRPRAVVTGATSGIGLELARVLAAEGYDLVLVARSGESLDQVAVDLRERHGTRVQTVPADLSDPAGPAAVAEAVRSAGDRLDVLVNNAGAGVFGAFAETALEDELALIALNITAVTALTKLLLPSVRAARGRILNVASTAAFQPGPFMAAYYASKAYVLHFSEALASELRGSGVTVTTLCPGVVPTGFQARAGVGGIPLVKAPGALPAATVAQAAYRGMVRGRRVVVPGTMNKLGVQLTRLAPRRVTAGVVRRLHAR